MSIIKVLRARPVFNSGGSHTVEVDVCTDAGLFRACSPGCGVDDVRDVRLRVQKEVDSVNAALAPKLLGKEVTNQDEVDRLLASEPKSGAVLAVSMAVCRAGAAARGLALFEWVAKLAGQPADDFVIPVPAFGLVGGGACQELMVMPVGARSFRDAVEMGTEVYHSLRAVIKKTYGQDACNVGEEGGFTLPARADDAEALDVLVEALERCGHRGNVQLAIKSAGSKRRPELYKAWAAKYPLTSIEDAFEPDRWEPHMALAKELGEGVQLVGGELLVSSLTRIKEAAQRRACDALLLRLSEVGTVSEAITAGVMAIKQGWGLVVSHCSGETEDSFIADFAVGLRAGQIKAGAPCRSERLAKYNQLLRIEEELGGWARYAGKAFRQVGMPSTVIDASLKVTTMSTAPIPGQKPGTSGLRKKTRDFMEPGYLQNYVQSVFNALRDAGTALEGGTLVVSGDGRYWNSEAIQIIIRMAFANGVRRVWAGSGGLLSTPAASAVIRARGGGGEPFGGFICSASHNPGGIDGDFGIKYNCENGGPAPERLTDAAAAWATKIKEYHICAALPALDLARPRTYRLGGGRLVEVFDCTEDHTALLQRCFDFGQIRRLIARPDFSLCYDSMSGVQGPYAKRILERELGAPLGSCTNAEPKEDFGGPHSPWHGHADPNLTYAVELVATMGLNKEGSKVPTARPPPTFGAAADGDADRNMIMGSQFFVSPSDSLAIIVANSSLIPQFAKTGLGGCARSMPTSCALDLVARKRGIPCFEVPTGWKFFGNLMDSGSHYFPGKPVYTPFICGEESFGTGADHVREKDGMWAVLAWLQILAAKTERAGKLVTVEDVARAHWQEFGRNYYARYDYEGVDKAKAEEMMRKIQTPTSRQLGGMRLKANDVFNYTDPVDGSESRNQGLRFLFEDGSRIVFRLSGTGVAGATIRLYLEKYVGPNGDLGLHPFEVVKPLASIALEISKLREYTGRDAPTVIT